MAETYDSDLELALTMADAVDRLTLARFGAADLVVDAKPDMTPVSDADRAAEQLIRATLGQHRPDDAILGEEFGVSGSGRRRWVIDPIDGTKNYVRGVPVWATLIALLDDDEPLLGVVSAPALARRWWAARGQGAFVAALGGAPRRLSVSAVAALGDASLAYASLPGWETIGRAGQFRALLDMVWRTRGYGDFWPYMMVAEGAVDIAAEPELALWDMAALAPIVTEAGGRFTGVGGETGLSGGNALATNGLLHPAVLDALR